LHGSTVRVALLALSVVGRPAEGQIRVVAGPTTTEVVASVGQRVTLPVAVDMTGAGGTKLGAYRLSLRWDPELLRFSGAAGGAFGAPVFNTDSAAQGVVKFAAAVPGGADGIVNLGGVTLEVVSTRAADTFDLAFQELVAAETFANLLPHLVVTSAVFCGGPVFGDVDNNGAIQARDAQIVLMHAVGLALPAGSAISRGDVDADSKIDPRDALIILSRVVGLDVSQFRVGQFIVAPCRGTVPATLSIRPRPIVLAEGDLFAAAAEVRDSAGKLLAGLNLAWSSSDTSKVRVSGSGVMTAVALGSSVITAAVSPGVSDTVTVTVGERRRWVVNPLLAQHQASQIGSELYPFSSIGQALARARDGDTVFLASATYHEPISTTKQLVFLGDSVAGLPPTISVPGGAAGVITRRGQQIIRWIRVSNSGSGLWISADRVEIGNVRLEGVAGPALVVRGADTVRLKNVLVSTAGGVGVMVDTAAVAVFERVRVAGVGGLVLPVVTGADYRLHAAGIVARADSVYLDSVAVEGVTRASSPGSQGIVGVFALNSRVSALRRVRVADVAWDEHGEVLGLGIGADTVVKLVADSVLVRRVAGPGIGIRGDSLVVTRARLEAVRSGIDGGARSVRLERSTIVGAGWGVRVFGDSTGGPVGELVVCNVVVGPLPGAAVAGFYLGRVELSGLETDTAAEPVSASGSAPASVLLFDVDNILIQGSRIRNSRGSGLWAVNSGRVVADGNEFLRSAQAGVLVVPGAREGVDLRLSFNTVAENGLGVALPVFDSLGSYDSVVVVKNTLRGNWVGMGLDSVRAGTVVIDTNLAVDNVLAGVVLARPAVGRLNSFFRNQQAGLAVMGVPGGGDFGYSNFEGNGVGAYNAGADSLYVRQSWWGDSLGPRGCSTCNLASRGDSISGPVAYQPFATDTVAGAPLGAPLFGASLVQASTRVGVPPTQVNFEDLVGEFSGLGQRVSEGVRSALEALGVRLFFRTPGKLR
jgi:hypothetical protein